MRQHAILQGRAKTLKNRTQGHFLDCKYYFYAEKGLLPGSSALGVSISRLLLLLCPTAMVLEKMNFQNVMTRSKSYLHYLYADFSLQP